MEPAAAAAPAEPAAAPAVAALGFQCSRVVAPMVGASDLAFRLLCRRHGADTAYTEMFFAHRFVNDREYRRRKLQTTPDDRPLIVQFCGHDPAVLAAAAKLAEPHCDAVDLNLGCPLKQARDGRFGSYLLDREHWELVGGLVAAMRAAVSVPVCCKIRLLPTLEQTLEFCRLLERAGCSMIAVHGRYRPPASEKRKPIWQPPTAADLDAIRAVANAVAVPVLSNGSTQYAMIKFDALILLSTNI